MKVLSLFDGMSCGRIALERAEIPVTRYYASEIDKYAIQVAQNNWPDNVQLGSVVSLRGYMFPKIDLLLGGSPCQGFSFAGKQLNFEDPRSKLFFEYVQTIVRNTPLTTATSSIRPSSLTARTGYYGKSTGKGRKGFSSGLKKWMTQLVLHLVRRW